MVFAAGVPIMGVDVRLCDDLRRGRESSCDCSELGRSWSGGPLLDTGLTRSAGMMQGTRERKYRR